MADRSTAEIVAGLNRWIQAADRYGLAAAQIDTEAVKQIRNRLEELDQEVTYHRECRKLDVPDAP